MDAIKPLYIYVSKIGPISGHMTLTIATFLSTTPNVFRKVAITANRKSSVCVENMATAGRFAASSEELGKCTYRHTI